MKKGLSLNVVGALALALLLSAGVAPEAPVADAAMRGDREAVRSLLQGGADVNAAQGDGMTALHWSGVTGDAELTQILVYGGANLEAVTRIGAHTPLHVAARSGSVAVVQALLGAGADFNAVTTSGVTPLHYAALAGSPEAITAILDKGAVVDVTEPGFGMTPLMIASAKNRLAAVRVLLERGADPERPATSIDLPASQIENSAAQDARDQVLEAFRSASTNPDLWQPNPAQVQAAVRAALEVERNGSSAAPGGDAAAAEEGTGGGGADAPNPGFAGAVGEYGNLSSLHLAVREGFTDIVVALLDAGADINLLRKPDDTSPIVLAAINGHYDLVKLLLDRGADPNLATTAGAAPLYSVINKEWAPTSRHMQPTYQFQQKIHYLELMETLLKAGADPNARIKSDLWWTSYDRNELATDFTGATPFWRAAYGADVAAMELLLKYGADPSMTTLVAAGGGGRGGRGGGDGPDASGLPPVPPGGPNSAPILAASATGFGLGFASNDHHHVPDGFFPAVKYLVENHGADVNARDAQGYAPLHFAAARGDNEMILYLVEKGADVTVVARNGRTTADMANGPQQRISPFLDTVALLEKLGSKNNHRCQSC